MTELPPMQEGRIQFSAPSVDSPCFTYYKIFGNLQSSERPPLVVLHGGPGSGHEYMLPFQKLWSLYGITVIFYDQIGCAGSTRLPHKADDHSFWKLDLFILELENLLNHFSLSDKPFDILGHSFGGVLGVTFASRQPKGLRRLILAGPPASGELFLQGAWRLLGQLSVKSQHAVKEAVKNDDYSTQSYREAANEWARNFWSRADPWPGEALNMNLKHQAEDPTVRRSLLGRSIWAWEGSLAEWSSIPTLPQINVPTLLYNGEFDTAQDEATLPFFEHIPRVRWVTLANASHMHHLDSPELEQKVMTLIIIPSVLWNVKGVLYRFFRALK